MVSKVDGVGPVVTDEMATIVAVVAEAVAVGLCDGKQSASTPRLGWYPSEEGVTVPIAPLCGSGETARWRGPDCGERTKGNKSREHHDTRLKILSAFMYYLTLDSRPGWIYPVKEIERKFDEEELGP